MIRSTKKMPKIDRSVLRHGNDLLRRSLSKPIRTMRQFADEEIVLPNGMYAGQRFRSTRMPATKLWFDLVDSRRWFIHVVTGPSQSGKTLCCFVIPVLWCLFEKEEDVIVGLPDMNMSASKWSKDIRPVIQASRYHKLLPRVGTGSKGSGKIRQLQFGNGRTLTFMSFGGDDKSRAGETAPNLIITETDGGGEPATTSDEASPIEQLIARTASYDLDAFIVAECTVSTTQGQTWVRYLNGTASRIVRPCPKCGHHVTPEREHFRGWELADNEIDAGDSAGFHCPDCGEKWTDVERFEANQHSLVVHKGQEVKDGQVVGPYPKTSTLGFRWSAVDNMFRTSAYLGRAEWTKSREVDQDSATKALDQFQYAIPWQGTEAEDEVIDPYEAMQRIGDTRRGVVPTWGEVVTVGVDVGDRKVHYSVWAWSYDATCRVIDYGEVKVFRKRLGPEKGITAALRYLRDTVMSPGFAIEGDKRVRWPDQIWVDAGWRPQRIYHFTRESQQIDLWRGRVMPCVGRGAGVQYRTQYVQKNSTSKYVPYVGDDFYFSHQRKANVTLAIVNADSWKSFVQARFKTPLVTDSGEEEVGAASLFIPEGGDHAQFTKHLAAERETTEFVPDKGEIKKWVQKSRVNHYFDTSYLACAAARFIGVELQRVPLRSPEDYDPVEYDGFETPDGRDFFDVGGRG